MISPAIRCPDVLGSVMLPYVVLSWALLLSLGQAVFPRLMWSVEVSLAISRNVLPFFPTVWSVLLSGAKTDMIHYATRCPIVLGSVMLPYVLLFCSAALSRPRLTLKIWLFSVLFSRPLLFLQCLALWCLS